MPEGRALIAAVHILPVLTTALAIAFTIVLYHHWHGRTQARHLMWWLIGVVCFGLGALAEVITAIAGWRGSVFRLWYIAGALLGGAPLAQGTVYLLFTKRTADRLAIGLIAYAAIAAGFVIATPLAAPVADSNLLSGKVIEWEWVRLLTPLINMYAVVFLVGGAAWSAVRYRRRGDTSSRVLGNWLIAIGAILPAIGGALARAGAAEALYVTELTGLLTIWAGYRVIVGEPIFSIHHARERVT